MPASTITVTILGNYTAGPSLHTLGTIAWSPSTDTYTSGGNACSFALPGAKTQRTPWRVDVWGASGYVYKYVFGSDNTNGKLQIFTGAAAQSPLTELSAGAIPAGVSGDTIYFEMVTVYAQ